ncbi:MAG: rhamnulokinase [Verrucomicrobia bacterium]|nr:rhamnulokinase [Verrucomicrobiota bacterium]
MPTASGIASSGALEMMASMSEATFIAVDLGAGSGRVMAATTDLETLRLEEVHRFDNPGVDLPGGWFWNIHGLYLEILEGLRRAVAAHGRSIVSIGIDTWGCDHALLAADGRLLGMPHQYRDPRSDGMADVMHAILPEETIYAHTGIRTNFYNSSLHLLAELRRDNPALHHASRLLFIPDLLSYWLTGRMAVERTIASTSQLLDPHTGDWAWQVIDALGLPRHVFGAIVAPGTVLGPLRDEVGAHIGQSDIPVIATASHDTASAVAGIPMEGGEQLWLSSGTWSILGMESPVPITTPTALAAGFCNELGADGGVRFLKNIAGLWVLQECRRQWEHEGQPLDYPTMTRMAAQAPAFTAFVDPDDPVFATPGDMPGKIREWCRRTGQPVPADPGAVLRVATESLALKSRAVYESIVALTGRRFTRLHVGGGGIRNEPLCQATADALGIEVVAGPVEATSCGNIAVQLVASGMLADLAAARSLIRRSFEFRTHQPRDPAAWEDAFGRFRRLTA